MRKQNARQLVELHVSVALSADPDSRRITATPAPGARERHLVEAIRDGLARHPEWADWDWIYDEADHFEDLTVEGMRSAAAAFNSARTGGRAWSIVVTTDRFFDNWRQVLDLTFEGRRHSSAPSLAAADQLLRRLRTEARSPAAPTG